MLRREWRQQVLILCMLAVAVAAGVFAALAGFNLTTPSDRTYGSGTVRFEIAGNAGDTIGAIRGHFGEAGVIASTSVAVKGSIERLEVRSQAPADHLVAPMLALVHGNLPQGIDDVALTDGAADLLDAGLGDHVELDGRDRTVVGVVENPTDLDDEFALVGHGQPLSTDSSIVIVDAGEEAAYAFRGCLEGCGFRFRWEEPDDRGLLVLAAYGVMAVAMIEVALLAAAGFAVIGRRRLRQYGILGAVGGTDRQIRQAAVTNGAAVGLVGSVIGTAAAITAVAATQGPLERVAGHRIDLAVPWWVVVPGAIIAIAGATAAAWWPSRDLSRQPIVEALAARRPVARPAKRSVVRGLILSVGGIVAVVFGNSASLTMISLVGLAGAVVGILLLAPAVVVAIGRTATVLALPGRIAGRDLARHQSRSTAALASIVIVLGIPVAIAVLASSGDARSSGDVPNLPPGIAIAWIPDADGLDVIPADLDTTDAQVALGRIQSILPDAAVAPIEVAIDPEGPLEPDIPFGRAGTVDGVMPIVVSRTTGAQADGAIVGNETVVWIANEAMLDAFGLDRTLAPDASLLSTVDGPAEIGRRYDPAVRTAISTTQIDLPTGWRLSDSLLTAEAVREQGWEAITVGWVLVNPAPIGSDTRAMLQEAADEDVLIEVERIRATRSSFVAIAALAGSALALGVLAMTVSLIRAESASQTRTLAALGARRTTRRTISAATAGLLALAGATLAIPVGYLALVVAMSDPDTDYPFVVPWVPLCLVVIAVPTIAAAGAWLLDGREPPYLGKTPT